jgi:hypothetical protein
MGVDIRLALRAPCLVRVLAGRDGAVKAPPPSAAPRPLATGCKDSNELPSSPTHGGASGASQGAVDAVRRTDRRTAARRPAAERDAPPPADAGGSRCVRHHDRMV